MGPFLGPLFGSPKVNVGKPRPPNDDIPERILCSILQQNIQGNTPALRKVFQESIATRDPACSVLDFKIHCISCCVLDNSNTIDHLITKYISHQNLPRLGLELYQSNEKSFACGLIPPMSNTTSVGGRIKDPFPWSSHRPFTVHRNKNTKRLFPPTSACDEVITDGDVWRNYFGKKIRSLTNYVRSGCRAKGSLIRPTCEREDVQ